MRSYNFKYNKQDEYFTPPNAIFPILKYLKVKGFKKIWCPFDDKRSYFVKVLNKLGYKVVYTHIKHNNGDFFRLVKKLNKNKVDCIISNPPYSLKIKIIEELFKSGIPFAMLVGIAGLFESKDKFELFKANDFDIMYFDRRVNFFRNYKKRYAEHSRPPFFSVYVTSKLLPKRMVFERLDRNKELKNLKK